MHVFFEVLLYLLVPSINKLHELRGTGKYLVCGKKKESENDGLDGL